MRRLYLCLCIPLLLLACLQAQETSETDTMIRQAEPIPLPEITARSARVTDILREGSSLLTGPDEKSTIRSEIDSLSHKVSALIREQQQKDLESLELRELDDLKRSWDLLAGRAGIQQTDLSGRAQKLEEELGRLVEMKTRWDNTLSAAREQNAPPAVIDRINHTRSGISDFSQSLQDNSDFILIQLDRLADQLILIDRATAEVDQVIDESSRKILSFDRNPLWRNLPVKKDTSRKGIGNFGFVRNSLDDLQELYRDFQIRLIINFILFLFILFSIILLFIHLNRLIPEDDLPVASMKKLVKRPVSSGFLLGLAISYTLYADAPGSIRIIISILTLVPLTIIISDVLPAWFRRPVYGLIVLDILVRIHGLGYQDSVISRLYLLLINLLAVILLFWITGRGKSAQRIRNARSGNLKYYLLVFSQVLFFVGFFANIFGSVRLSGLLVSGTLIGIINAFLFYTLFLIAESLSVLLLKTRPFTRLNVIRKYSAAIQLRVSRLLSLVAVALWLVYGLRAFYISKPFFNWLGNTLSRSFSIGSLELSVWNILAFFLIIWLTLWITRVVKYILQDEVMTRITLKKGVPGAAILVVRVSLITVGFLIAIAAAGVNMSSLAILLGALGVGIGFGLQNIFNNLVSGIILAFERPINEGDIIELGTLLGTVKEIGIRASIIKTYDGAEVIVPNGNLISNELINWTLADKKRRAEVLVGVAYGTDPQRVIDLLLEVVDTHKDVLDDPRPLALFTGFGESSLDFRLLFWISDADNRLSIQSRIAVLVNRALAEAGIEIPYPQRDIHLRSGFTPPT